MSEFQNLTIDQIANIAFRKSERLEGPVRQKMGHREEDLRRSGVYDRMAIIWRAFCEHYAQREGQSSQLKDSILDTLRDDGNANNGDKKFFLFALTKHYKLSAQDRRKQQRKKKAQAS